MILLVHHGEAFDPAIEPTRPLTARGLEQVSRLAQAAAVRGVKPDVIWHSGKLRARQTAEAYWRHGNPLAAFSAVRGLLPGDPPEWMRDRLTGESRTVVVVGHMPHLPRLLRLLLRGHDDAPGVEFPPHGCVALREIDAGWFEDWRAAAD